MTIIAIHFRLENQYGSPYGEAVWYDPQYPEAIKFMEARRPEPDGGFGDIWNQFVVRKVNAKEISEHDFRCHIYDKLEV